KLNRISSVQESASAIAILCNGNLITSTCYFDQEGDPTGGEIVLRNPNGDHIKTLIEEPASAIAILDNGNMITSTCYFDEEGRQTGGEIVLRDPNGNRINTLIDEPAS